MYYNAVVHTLSIIYPSLFKSNDHSLPYTFNTVCINNDQYKYYY